MASVVEGGSEGAPASGPSGRPGAPPSAPANEADWRRHLPSSASGESAWDSGELLAGGSLPAVWTARWSSEPDRPVLSVAGGRWVSAGRLAEDSAGAARALQRAGAVARDRVLWCTAASEAALVANVGALRAGLVVVPVNPELTDTELAHVVADAGPTVAVVDDGARAAALAGGALGAAAGSVVVVGPDLVPAGGAASVGPAVPDTLDAAGPDDPAVVLYTSGTTGRPKGAVLTHRNVLANARALALAWRWHPDDRLVLALPLFHAHGLCAGLYGTLTAGASAVVLPRFEPGAVLDTVGEHRASLFFGVPTAYHRLASSGRAGELAALRLAVSGSAPLSAELHRAVRDASGLEILERYGLTETLMNLSNPVTGERRPGSVGFALPGVEVRLAGAEVQVRGPTVMAGYWQRPAQSAEAFEDGWFRTGDRAERDRDGYVRILGRSKELVISGGFNVYPAEVEDALLAHPAVTEVGVSGTPSDEWGEVVTAWVVADGPAPAVEELLAFAALRLAPYKRPRIVHFVDSLPRTALGKVRRGELR